ncbi:hypothetical protein QCA50_007144 [Cerrena zonata]|uniref:Autophagy-related protein 13 n=1 Tax=Cerrena zonata TaxID=2478898 RepID=A0AAW0G7H1_9APHY
MSNDIQKADQIVHRFYTKLSLVVNHARASAEPSQQGKVDKWFNLETPDADTFKRQTNIYRSISSASSSPLPPFNLQVLLSIPDQTNNQVLVYTAPDSSRSPIDPAPKYILLESWNLTFAPHQTHFSPENRPDVAPSTIYKHGISLFRSAFTYLRILPAWKLARRLRSQRNGKFSIVLRVDGMAEASSIHSSDVLGFGAPVHNHSALPTDMYDFSAVPHPQGSLSLSVTYLTSPNFRVVDRESLLSSRFLSQDEGPEFTPTLLKNQQRDSFSPSPGSLPLRTSLPRSPPSSIAERFIVAPHTHTRTTSLSGASPRLQSVALPMNRAPSASGALHPSASGVSDGSSTRQGGTSFSSREESLHPSSQIARLRRESLGRGSESPSPSPAGAVPIRNRPQIQPFKSGALSSGSPSLHSPSPSVRQQSPLTSGGAAGSNLPSRPPLSPISSRAPPSPISIGGKVPLSSTPHRPSPPYAPSSLGDRRSLASAEGAQLSGTPAESSPASRRSAKRYSSSFGHRYAATGGAGSEGSAGSGARDQDRPPSASFLSVNTDDDDISAFVQDIDSRKPLGSQRDHQSQLPSTESDEPPISTAGPSRPRAMSLGPTTKVDFDEEMKEMNDKFMAALAGISSSRRQGSEDRQSSTGSSTARAPSSGTPTIGRRTMTFDSTSIRQTDEPLSIAGPSPSRRASLAGAYPSYYSRPRFPSTGSARSGMSIASEEVLGRMDPEIEDERRHSRGQR